MNTSSKHTILVGLSKTYKRGTPDNWIENFVDNLVITVIPKK